MPRYADIDPARSIAFGDGRFRGVCTHGLTALECSTCVKLDGECDFGDCTAPATTRSGRGRRVCAADAALLATLGQ